MSLDYHISPEFNGIFPYGISLLKKKNVDGKRKIFILHWKVHGEQSWKYAHLCFAALLGRILPSHSLAQVSEREACS